jgi:hypothetical protein
MPDRRASSVLVYRGDELVARRGVRRGTSMGIAGIPLRRGENELSVEVSGPQVSPRSNVVSVTRDDQAPRLRVTDPSTGQTINAENVAIRGTTEPGATLALRNETTSDGTERTVGSGGTFEVELPLDRGTNVIVVRARDEAGNVATETVSIVRGEGLALARLDLSDAVFRVSRLPATISLQLVALDADGAPVDGASVVFSLSPPGLVTQTYRTTTTRGSASWTGVTLPAQGAVEGRGVATALVTLEDGTVITGSTSFEFR